MQAKLLNTAPRTWALVFATGDAAVAGIERFAAQEGLAACQVSAIGAVSGATLGYFDWERKAYQRIELNEQLEVLSLNGDIAERDGRPQLHAHAVFGRADATTRGGHLMEARVRPTLEVMLTESPAHLRRVLDPETGLALIRVRA
jgi:uncharacterized protein